MSCDADRLSDLPDDLLLRILHFAPAKEAASTTALSQGWRSALWRSSGAVNLETRIVEAYDRYRHRWHGANKGEQPDEALFFSRRDAFVSAAEAALDAADVPVTRLTLRLEVVGREESVNMFLHHHSDVSSSPDPDVLVKLLSHRAARQVEELSLAADYWSVRRDPYNREDKIIPLHEEGMFTLCLSSLPSETLRVLELTACNGLVPLPPASAAVFPRLSSMRLRHCTALTEAIQSLVDASPALTAIHLESVTITQQPHDESMFYGALLPPSTETVRLHFPAGTVLVLDRCNWKVKPRPYPHDDTEHVLLTVEIDAPRLQRYRYKGFLQPVLLSPPPPDLARPNLHFIDQTRNGDKDLNREQDLVTFWRFLQSFPNARELKLKVTALEHIAVLTKARRLELVQPAVLSNLHRLELHGVHRPKGTTAAVAIANLLRCCPVLRDLLINLTVEHHEPAYSMQHNDYVFLERKFRSDRDKSICLFNRHSNSNSNSNSAPILTPPPPPDGINYEEVSSEIPGLSHRSFDCLRTSLTRVGLRFRLEDQEPNCFGVRLIKFFAENAMVLEEMCIDAGNQKLDDHLACKIQRWIAHSSLRRKPGASRFVVLPLNRN